MTRAEKIEAAARRVLGRFELMDTDLTEPMLALRAALSEEEGTPAAKVGPGFCSIRSDPPSPATPSEAARCDYNAWCSLPRGHRDGCLSEDEAHRLVSRSGRATPRGDR